MYVDQTPQVVVHDLEQARAALAAAAGCGRVLQLRSAPDAAAYAGIGYLQALGAAAGHELLIDCGDDAGLVMAALRSGCRKLVFTGSRASAAKLADMAAEVGAALCHEPAPSGT
jgi:acyl-CoA reductase-like NAD-dependent aldehyde dehydrogenase